MVSESHFKKKQVTKQEVKTGNDKMKQWQKAKIMEGENKGGRTIMKKKAPNSQTDKMLLWSGGETECH